MSAPEPQLQFLSWTVEGGSLSLGPDARRRRRQGLFISLLAQVALGLMFAFGLIPKLLPGLPVAQVPADVLTYMPPALLAPLPTPRPQLRRHVHIALPPTPPHPTPPVRRRAEVHPPPPPPMVELPSHPAPPALPRPLPPPAPLVGPIVAKVETGRFGTPLGAQPTPARPLPIPQLGAFGAAPTGAATPHPAAAVDHNAGFDPSASAPPASASGRVRLNRFGETATPAPTPAPAWAPRAAGFDRAPVITAAPAPESAPKPNTEPPQIVAWPTPTYTPSARAHHIEGDVLLRVRLGADGTVTVLQVESGLGYGLDHAAEQAARQLQFRPARRRGLPVDWTAILHVRFRLAD